MIRPARFQDSNAIAQVQVASWQAGYVGLIAQAYLDSLSVANKTASWQKMLADPAQTIAVYDAPPISGFVRLASYPDAEAGPNVGEVTAIYVDPLYWGQGFGHHLLNWAMDTGSKGQWDRLILWVLQDNERARSLYERAGWRPDGVQSTERFHETDVTKLRYTWSRDI